MTIVFGMLTPTVAVIILVIALIVFGPGKLPELGKSLGKGIKEFKSASEGTDEKQEASQPAPVKAIEPAGKSAPASAPAEEKEE